MDKRKRLDYPGGEEIQLPEELSWENMESGILSDLEVLDGKTTAPERLRSGKPWLLLLCLAVLASFLVIGMLYYPKKSTAPAYRAADTDHLNRETSIVSSEDTKTATSHPIDPENTQEEIVLNPLVTNGGPVETMPARGHQTDLAYAKNKVPAAGSDNSQNTIEDTAPAAQVNNVIEEAASVHTADQKPNTMTIPATDRMAEDVTTAEAPVSSKSIVQADVASIPLVAINEVASVSAQEEAVLAILPQPAQGHRSSARWVLGVAAGATYLQPNIKLSSAPPSLKLEETGVLGYGMECNLAYQLRPAWQLKTGVGYRESVTRFDYTSTKDTATTEMVTYNLISAISGEQVGTDSTEVTATGTVTRQVVHFNTYRAWYLPVQIVRQWPLGDRWSLSTGLGGQYVLSATPKGKTIQTDEDLPEAFLPVDFSSSLVDLAGTISLSGDLGLQYQLSSQLGIGIATQFRYSLADIQAQPGIEAKPFGNFTRLGLQYRF